MHRSAAPARRTPDLIVAGARVHGAPRGADAIAIAGDRITRIGAAADVRATAGRRTRMVEASGGLILPGFQDAHVHPPFAGQDLSRVWLNDLDTRAGYLDAIATYASEHAEEPWILGGGWSMAAFPGGLPRREDLDAIVGDRPVFLFNRDAHGAWVNSRALELAGITAATPDPADGRIERDTDGRPTGCLHEGAAYRVDEQVVPAPTGADWRSAILAAQAHLHALGITGWQDAWVTPATQLAYEALAGDGRLTARVVGALWWERGRGIEQVADLVERRGAARQGDPAARFLPTTVKIMVDGVLENFTGALLEPYCDGCGGRTENRGLSFVEREALARAVTDLDARGFQVHLHAIGDRALRDGLDAIAAARAANGSVGGGSASDPRHHIAHLQVVQPEDIPRFAELGVTANAQAYWAMNDSQMDELTVPFLGRERADLQYPFASLLHAGARLAMGSDWAVSTANPLEQIEVAVTRAERGGQAFLPDERLTLNEALHAFTVGSAFVNHDGDAGVLEVGRRADLAVLDRDIGAAGFGDGAIGDAAVQLTVAAGRVVHERPA
jgi:predicted amidohydrolase YtcJ